MRRWSFAAVMCTASVVAGALVASARAAPEPGGAPSAKPQHRSPKWLKVRKILPRHGRSRVDVAAWIEIRLSQPADEDTVVAAHVELRELLGGRVDCATRLEDGGRTIVLVPRARLAPAQDHEIIVRPGLLSETGRTLRREKRSGFFTLGRPGAGMLRREQFAEVAGRMVETRAAHTATSLPDGRVLLAGGMADPIALDVTAETYLPDEQRFVAAANLLPSARAFHAAAAVGDDVLLIGGWDGLDAAVTTTWFRSADDALLDGPPMTEHRDYLAAVTLADGRVLVTGGLAYVPGGARYSDTAEILEDGAFRPTRGAPWVRRAGHTLTLLPDGRVVAIGGTTTESGFAPSVEFFDPVTETFRETAPASWHRQLHTATVLANGLVLVADGGAPVLEVFDSARERWFAAGGAGAPHRVRATATLLPGGEVLLLGGLQSDGDTTLALDTMDVFVPTGGDVGRSFGGGVWLAQPRALHTATSLPSGQVLIAGGVDPAGGPNLDTALLFTPAER